MKRAKEKEEEKEKEDGKVSYNIFFNLVAANLDFGERMENRNFVCGVIIA
jgi:hypothetical protein